MFHGSDDLRQHDFKPVDQQPFRPCSSARNTRGTAFIRRAPSQKIHIEARRGCDGKSTVYFNIRESWQDEADRMGIEIDPDLPTGRNIFLQATLIIAATASSLLLAWRNIRAGRGDSGGAQKLAGVFLILGMLVWLLCANHVPQLFLELHSFFRVLGFILVPAAIVWMFYLALEPYVRRIWPETVISWSRASGAENWSIRCLRRTFWRGWL